MDRQKPTTTVRHYDDFTKALIESTAAYLGGEKVVSEEGIPTLPKKENADTTAKKDPKAGAAPADPAVDLRTGSGIKQSHGATIRNTTILAKEEKCTECKKDPCCCDEKEEKMEESCGSSHGEMKKEKKEKKEKEEYNEELTGTTYDFELNGVTYVFEKVAMDGKDDNGFKSCWKGYKKQGTKVKGGKEVNNCVKEEEELQEKAVSKAQQRFMGMVHAKKKGEMKGGSEEVNKAAKSMTGKEAEKFASTKHKGLPEKKMKKEDYDLTEKKLDPLGKEDKDIDNDGDHDKSDKYLLARRGKVSKIIAAKKKMKEEAELRKEIEEEKK